jgi:hypothetical protein
MAFPPMGKVTLPRTAEFNVMLMKFQSKVLEGGEITWVLCGWTGASQGVGSKISIGLLVSS